MPLTFEIVGPDGARWTETLAQPVIKIGRHEASHVCLADERVARMHAVIEQDPRGDDAPTVIDLGNPDGTLVNGTRVNKAPLARGDVLTIGPFMLRVLAAGPADQTPAEATAPSAPVVPLAPALREVLRAYAERSGLPARTVASIANAPATAFETSFWHVETHVWWERRFFRYMGTRETGATENQYHFGSVTLPIASLPDRWTIPHARPDEFFALEHRVTLDAVPGQELELEVLFGTETHLVSLGDANFPVSLLDALPVQARFQGVDTVPTVLTRGGAPYRETSLPMDRPDIPTAVMQTIRDFVRHIDLPGYTDRIHGWRTLVRGGPFVRARLQLEAGGLFKRERARAVDALIVERAGAVYAPDLFETR